MSECPKCNGTYSVTNQGKLRKHDAFGRKCDGGGKTPRERTYGEKRIAERGTPSQCYEDVYGPRDVSNKWMNGEIPDEAEFTEQYGSPAVTWYGWTKDSNGDAEVYSAIDYGRSKA